MELQPEYYASPRWTYELLDCSMPMTFDTYSNCAHQCVYCFAYFQRAIGDSKDDYLSHLVKAVNVDKIKQMFLEPEKYAGQFAWYIKKRMVMQWGGMSDGFDWYEKKFRKSLELLRFFREIEYPVSISTKGTWFVDDPEYREVLKDNKFVHFKISIITHDEAKAKILEAGCPAPMERMRALEELNKLGVGYTTLRFRPFIPGVSEEAIDPLFRAAKDAGVPSVTTEWLCLESRASGHAAKRFELISSVCGFDILEYYRENSQHAAGLLRLNYDLKREPIAHMVQSAKDNGLRFFVSDAHHKHCSDTAACCGLPTTGPLSVYWRGHFAEAILIAKAKGKVHWEDIAEQASLMASQPFIGSKGFNIGSPSSYAKRKYQTMADYIRDQWNTPSSWQSPARYFGGALVPAGTDSNGDIVYLYNKPFIEDGTRIESVVELAQRLGVAKSTREQSEQDGNEMGHVAYPIYVLSKDRPYRTPTVDALELAHLPYTMYVINGDKLPFYMANYPNADIVPLPEDMTPQQVRNYILIEARRESHQWIWMLDDDIKGWYKYSDGLFQIVNPRAVLSGIEGLTDHYSNVAIAGPAGIDNARGLVDEMPFAYNRQAREALLINTSLGLDFQPLALHSALEYQLQALTKGQATLVSYNYAIGAPAPGANSGGCAPLYLAGQQEIAAKELHKLYPNVVSLQEGPHGKEPEPWIDWRSFTQPLQIRTKEETNG